jgi:hypothetical protein
MDHLPLTKEKIAAIKEKVSLKSALPWLKEHYKPDVFDDEDYNYAYCLYIRLETKKILLKSDLFSAKPKKFDLMTIGNGQFINYLREYSPKDFEGLLFLIDAYPINIKALREDFCHGQSPLFEVVESILKPSQGIILWHYQLENILKLFFHPTEVELLRRGFCAKKPETLEKLESISIDHSLSLVDFISNRMYVFRQYTKSPNIKGTYELFRWLRS